MARYNKYIIAPNGKPHMFNRETGKSYCGRVTQGADGTRMTNKLPEGSELCGRDVQLAGGVDTVSNVVRDVPGVGKVAVVTTKPADKPVATKKAATGTRASNSRKSGAVVTLEAPDQEAVYEPLSDFLSYNEIGSRIERDMTGSRLSFDAAGFAYDVWAPTWNANGPDEGWVIQFNDDPSSNDPGYAEPMLSTMADVIGWLAEDLSLPMPDDGVLKSLESDDVPEAPKRRGRKPSAKTVLRKAIADVQADAMATMSAADHARLRAREGGIDAADVFSVITTIKKAANELHVMLNGYDK